MDHLGVRIYQYDSVERLEEINHYASIKRLLPKCNPLIVIVTVRDK